MQWKMINLLCNKNLMIDDIHFMMKSHIYLILVKHVDSLKGFPYVIESQSNFITVSSSGDTVYINS